MNKASGSGSGSVTVTAAANTGAARSTTITIAGRQIAVSEAAGKTSGGNGKGKK